LSGESRSGSLIRGALEMDVAPTAVSAFQEDEAAGIFETEVVDELACFSVAYESSGRQEDDAVFAVFAVALLSLAVAAGLSLEFLSVAQMNQSSQVSADFEDQISAPAAVSAGRSSMRNIFLSAEGYAAVSALSGRHFDKRFISKFHHMRTLLRRFEADS